MFNKLRHVTSLTNLSFLVIIFILAGAVSYQLSIVKLLRRENSSLINECNAYYKSQYILQTQNQSFRDKFTELTEKISYCTQYSGNYESSKKCGKSPNIREFLSVDLKEKVGIEGILGDIRTYEIYPLSWDNNCEKIAFLLELVGRDNEAYEPDDYTPRGIYIFEVNSRNLITAYLLPHNRSLDQREYESDYWFGDSKYVFVETTDISQNIINKKRYEFDVNTNTIELSKSY